MQTVVYPLFALHSSSFSSERVFHLEIDETTRQLDNALNMRYNDDDDFMLSHSPLYNAN